MSIHRRGTTGLGLGYQQHACLTVDHNKKDNYFPNYYVGPKLPMTIHDPSLDSVDSVHCVSHQLLRSQKPIFRLHWFDGRRWIVRRRDLPADLRHACVQQARIRKQRSSSASFEHRGSEVLVTQSVWHECKAAGSLLQDQSTEEFLLSALCWTQGEDG